LNDPVPGVAPTVETGEAFARRIFGLLIVIMLALALAVLPALWIRYGAAMALSFVLGRGVSLINFYWLRRTLEAVGDRFQATGNAPSAIGMIARFLLRYVLIAAAAYVILRGTTNSLAGLLAGLSLPVGAILILAVVETFRALRAGL
jgi:hypothetical protein